MHILQKMFAPKTVVTYYFRQISCLTCQISKAVATSTLSAFAVEYVVCANLWCCVHMCMQGTSSVYEWRPETPYIVIHSVYTLCRADFHYVFTPVYCIPYSYPYIHCELISIMSLQRRPSLYMHLLQYTSIYAPASISCQAEPDAFAQPFPVHNNTVTPSWMHGMDCLLETRGQGTARVGGDYKACDADVPQEKAIQN